MKPESVTVKNIEAAFAGESMAHIKYMYFAKICREQGDIDTAKVFEETAAQEVQHAFGHLDLLYPKADMTPAKALDMAIAGETYEYTEMYPKFQRRGRRWTIRARWSPCRPKTYASVELAHFRLRPAPVGRVGWPRLV